MSSTAIVWFRRDLRVHDHPALATAVREHDRVIPVFVSDPHFAGGRYASQRRAGYMRSALHALDQQLQRLGSRLHIRDGYPTDQIQRLAAETDADAVYFTTDVSPYARRRDQRIVDALGARARPQPGNYIAAIDRLATRNGGPLQRLQPVLPRLAGAAPAADPAHAGGARDAHRCGQGAPARRHRTTT